MTEKRRPGRPRGASPSRLASGKQGARLTLTIDGESVRRRVQLETADPLVADKKIEKLQAAEHTSPPSPSTDTFREVAAVVFAAREKRGVARVDIELGRVEGHVYPFVGRLRTEPFGDRALASISSDEVTELLCAKRDEGYSFEHVKKMRTGMKFVFEHAKLGAVIAEAPMPPFQSVLKKHRAVASDEVLLAYLRWEHPVPRFRAGVRMRQAMSAVSRCIGGQRTNDLHVATWEDNFIVPDKGEPDFSEVWVPRTKGQAPQLLETPEGVRPMLRLWWEQSGRPRKGPVFPLLRGERAGQAREVQDSHAHALRVDLKRALGIEVWDAVAGVGQKGPVGRWVPGRAPTAKEKALFEEGRYTLPVDFHSWRRAWSQALKKVGANVQTAAAVTGHASDLRAHGRYLVNPTEAQQVPAGAVPMLLAPPSGPEGFGHDAAKTPLGRNENLNDSGRARRDSNAGPLASEASAQNTKRRKTGVSVSPPTSGSDVKRPSETERGQNSRPEISGSSPLTAATLWELLALATKSKRTDLVQSLTEQIDALERALPPNVTSLDSRRRR